MRRALAIVVLLAAPALADDKVNARALQQQGIELYRAKKYEDAIAALAKSYQLDPQFDTLYALAQAERLGGHCPDAIPHYNKILEQTTDPTLAAAVQNNMGLCVTGGKKPDGQCTTTTTTTTTPIATPSHDKAPIALFALSGVLAGTAAGMFIASSHSQEAAGAADTFDSYNHFTERAGLERGLGYGFAAGAVAGIGAAVYLLVRKHDETAPTVAASHTASGTSVFVQARW